ncbi:hypothetical protein Godav_021040, partial [Gossypium davidsonii]|nr:hypothetical protein [Gossypium davidsonii]
VFHNQVFLPKILKEPKGNEFQKKKLHWLPVWSTCTMLEPLMQIQDSKPAKPNLELRIRALKRDWTIVYDMFIVDIIEQIDVEDVATINTHKERNDFHGCKVDVSLDDMDLSTTQPQPPRNQ